MKNKWPTKYGLCMIAPSTLNRIGAEALIAPKYDKWGIPFMLDDEITKICRGGFKVEHRRC